MHRMQAADPVCATELPYHEGICPQAFVDHKDGMCIPRQMSAILNIDFGAIVNELDEIQRELYGPGEHRGYSPAAVLQYAKLSGLACAVVHNGNTIEACEGNSPILCFCVLETHSYFYSCQKAAKALLKRQPAKKSVKMKKRV